ncbi:MAG: sulfotransferase, partial [Bacteroidetes bacterium]|nr:sulfotransferase [Bacteroidota bacterium]
MKSRIAFLLYDNRSGSTFLSARMESLRDCYVTNESDFTSRIFYWKNTTNENLIDFLFNDMRFVDMQITKEELNQFIENNNPDNKSLIEYILLTHFKKRYSFFEDKVENIIVIKHPPIGDFNLVRELWPNVKFIYLIRDGRDIHLSKYNSIDLYENRFSDNIIGSAINWNKKVALFSSISAKSDTIKYETLIKNEYIYDFLSNFLSIPNVINEEKEYPLPKNQIGFHTNVTKKTIKNNNRKYDENSYENFVYNLFSSRYLLAFDYPTININKIFKIKYILYLFRDILLFILFTTYNSFKYLIRDRYLFISKVK